MDGGGCVEDAATVAGPHIYRICCGSSRSMARSGGRGEHMKLAFPANTSLHMLTTSTGWVDLDLRLGR
jgi:hypothetical protein